MYQGDIALVDEIEDQEFDGAAYGAGGVSTFGISEWLTNHGRWCTLTKECQAMCN